MIIGAIFLGLIVIIALWFIATYNGLVKTRNQVDEAWSDIDVQLKQRYDLVPNLINTVKGYASHEKELFENVTKARANAMKAEGAGGAAASAQAEGMLSNALVSLMAVAENYPQLNADKNFLNLQEKLADLEDKIQAARRFYNGIVRDFNTKVQIFPTVLIAGVLGFKEREFFEIEETQRENPKVNFEDKE